MRPSAVPPQAGHTSTLWRSRFGCGRVTPSTKSVGWTITGVGWLRRGVCHGGDQMEKANAPGELRPAGENAGGTPKSGRCGPSGPLGC